ncbi:MAG: DnaJ domain-containing protein [Armatimonadetes bacterium]|nr:DnaJ domain-containing protein [Armatimonadota bacterium]
MNGAKRDYYKIMGVAPIGTQEEIKKAYRLASKKYHPDLNPDLKIWSDEKMRELVEAYEILNDVDKRRAYDHQPHFQLKTKRKNPPPGSDTKESSRQFTKPTFRREVSLLDRIFAPFTKKSGSGDSPGRVDPKAADTHFTLGLSLSGNDSFLDQAINEFKLCVKFDPSHVEALYNLGIICYRKGMFEESLINFQKVLNVTKEDQYARRMVGLLREDY